MADKNLGGIHSFLGRLNLAAEYVAKQSKCETAPMLWHATATSSTNKSVDDVWGLDNLDATFIVDEKSVWSIKETHWAEWAEPTLKGPFDGDLKNAGTVKMALPVGAAEAEHSMRVVTGAKGQIKSVQLAGNRRFSAFTTTQAHYFFTMADGIKHGVGAEDGKVATED